MDTKKVVVLIAHSKMGDKIEGAFIRANFDVFRTEDSYQAMSFLKKENPHAMVVDWDLVNGTTKEIARIIRDNCRKTALVLLSKSRKAEERIQAFPRYKNW
jgi:DNA-binding response OmpR family regulator